MVIFGGIVYAMVQVRADRQTGTRIDPEIDLLTEEQRSEGPPSAGR